jgi:hypothetical protein
MLCQYCSQEIDTENEVMHKYRGWVRYYHPACFVKLRTQKKQTTWADYISPGGFS